MVDPFHPPEAVIQSFCRESNFIEGEKQSPEVGRLNPGDIGATRKIIALSGGGKSLTEEILLDLHKRMGEYLKEPWVGEYRRCNVQVGAFFPCDWRRVKPIMDNYYLDWNSFDSWGAHTKFEKIHPFQDLNGRTGRLLWLWKALQEGYRWERGFLHHFYYQTLQHSH